MGFVLRSHPIGSRVQGEPELRPAAPKRAWTDGHCAAFLVIILFANETSLTSRRFTSKVQRFMHDPFASPRAECGCCVELESDARVSGCVFFFFFFGGRGNDGFMRF